LQAATDVLYIVDCWGLRIEKVRIYGVSGRSCIYLHRPSGAGGNHAVSIDRIYTSSGTPVGILIDSDTGAVASIGVNISNCTLQGHGTAALMCLQASGVSISGLYTENTGIPIQLGDQSKNKWASNINVSGSTFMTYKTPITLDACTGVVFSGCNLNVNGLSSVWIRYKYARNISIISCTPNNIRDGIRRMSNARSEHGLTILQGSWDGPPDWPAASTPAMLVLRAINNGGVAHQHFCMSVDSTGAWVAKEWIPLQET
jgi:hypothetical protein